MGLRGTAHVSVRMTNRCCHGENFEVVFFCSMPFLSTGPPIFEDAGPSGRGTRGVAHRGVPSARIRSMSILVRPCPSGCRKQAMDFSSGLSFEVGEQATSAHARVRPLAHNSLHTPQKCLPSPPPRSLPPRRAW